MNGELLYAPDGAVGPGRDAIAPAPQVLSGLRVAVLDNGKPGAATLLSAAAEHLSRRVGTEFAGVRKKGSAATPCEAELLESLVAEADVFLTGTAD